MYNIRLTEEELNALIFTLELRVEDLYEIIYCYGSYGDDKEEILNDCELIEALYNKLLRVRSLSYGN